MSAPTQLLPDEDDQADIPAVAEPTAEVPDPQVRRRQVRRTPEGHLIYIL